MKVLHVQGPCKFILLCIYKLKLGLFYSSSAVEAIEATEEEVKHPPNSDVGLHDFQILRVLGKGG